MDSFRKHGKIFMAVMLVLLVISTVAGMAAKGL